MRAELPRRSGDGLQREATRRMRVGIVGVGRTAAGHAAAALAYPGASVTAVAEVDAEKGRAFAGRFGAQWFADFRDLCAGDVDVVVVTVPNFLHAPAVLAAVAHGRHVLCEKPLALDTRECERIIASAAAAGVQVGVAHHYHFTAPTVAARRAFQELDLGRPVMATDIWHKSFYDPPQRPPWFLQSSTGGGMWPMNGSHLVDRLMHTTGLGVSSVRAAVGSPFWGHDATDAGHAFLVFEAGFTASVAHAGYREGCDRFETEFVCERGMLRVTDREVAVGRGGAWTPIPLPAVHTFRDQFAAFASACERGTEPPVSAAWGRDVVAVLEACELSGRSGREVQVADVVAAARRSAAAESGAAPGR